MADYMQLQNVILIGRTFSEYRRIFKLDDFNLKREKILDVGSGVASFCAEANARGISAVGADPIYELPAEEIRLRCRHDLREMLEKIQSLPHYFWDFYKTPETLKGYRQRAYRRFLADYQQKGRRRYVPVKFPNSPFHAKSFTLALVSHFLFLHDDKLSLDFHQRVINELIRITSKEIRIYPVTSIRGMISPWLKPLLKRLKRAEAVMEPVDFEFLKGANQILRIFPKSDRH